MGRISRRAFIGTGLVAPLATAATAGATGAGEPGGPSGARRPVGAPPGEAVTRILARYLCEARFEQLPEPVRREGRRTLLNYLGVAVGASATPAVDAAVRALAPFAGPGQASILGRRERFDAINAAFVNGVSSHVFDYDDTHLKTIVHPGGPVVSAILALCEHRPASGAEFLNALVLGVETCCRIGNAVYPDHYDAGWHITGTAGVFGAAAAAGKLLALDEQQMCWALGLAASQPVGLRESFGSMNKSFNPGRAAANGLFAALLAQQGFTSSDAMIEARRGWAATVSTKRDLRAITADLGQHYEAALNTYKPYACGVVEHPAIDAAIQLRRDSALDPQDIASVALKVNPLVVELTGRQAPRDGLQGKFSIYHAVAIALLEGAAGQKQFSDAAVLDPRVVALRQRVVVEVDSAIKPEQVDMTLRLRDGRTLHKFVAHALGSVEAPMSDVQLEAKFGALADGILPAQQVRRLMDACWQAERLADAATIARLAVPG